MTGGHLHPRRGAAGGRRGRPSPGGRGAGGRRPRRRHGAAGRCPRRRPGEACAGDLAGCCVAGVPATRSPGLARGRPGAGSRIPGARIAVRRGPDRDSPARRSVDRRDPALDSGVRRVRLSGTHRGLARDAEPGQRRAPGNSVRPGRAGRAGTWGFLRSRFRSCRILASCQASRGGRGGLGPARRPLVRRRPGRHRSRCHGLASRGPDRCHPPARGRACRSRVRRRRGCSTTAPPRAGHTQDHSGPGRHAEPIPGPAGRARRGVRVARSGRWPSVRCYWAARCPGTSACRRPQNRTGLNSHNWSCDRADSPASPRPGRRCHHHPGRSRAAECAAPTGDVSHPAARPADAGRGVPVAIRWSSLKTLL